MMCISVDCLFFQVDKINESFGLINSMTKPLAAYLFTRDSKLQDQFERTISAGGMLLNDTSIHVREHMDSDRLKQCEFYREVNSDFVL
jgi:acyl-CoA reductase-like NAD-dependent aldehyde dehydrogenase